MRYFPVFLDLKERLCVVVGGGRVAERKIKAILRTGARVKVISPRLTASLARLKKRKRISHLSRTYRRGDLRGGVLVIGATDDRSVNERIFREAAAGRIPVNVVDDPAHSSFIVPSIVDKKDLLVAISTSGKSPALARRLRQKLGKEIGPEYERLLKLLGKVREKLLPLGLGQQGNQKIFRKLADEDLLPLIRDKKIRELNRRLASVLGPGYSLEELGLKWENRKRAKSQEPRAERPQKSSVSVRKNGFGARRS
jgi:precorrin-2 dehydrogenase/sirohydrochlorin ferrochelatase